METTHQDKGNEGVSCAAPQNTFKSVPCSLAPGCRLHDSPGLESLPRVLSPMDLYTLLLILNVSLEAAERPSRVFPIYKAKWCQDTPTRGYPATCMAQQNRTTKKTRGCALPLKHITALGKISTAL